MGMSYSIVQRWLPALLLMLCVQLLAAQGIRRSVIGSTGGSAATVTGVRLRSTVAQPPNAGTVFNGANYLRQGFQQPTTCAAAPEARFDALLEGPDGCGGLYRFTYLDNPDPNTQFFWTFGLGAQPPASYSADPDAVNYLAPGTKVVILEVHTDDCRSMDTLLLDVPVIPLSVTPNASDLWCREEEDGGISLFISGGTEPYSVTWSNGQSGADIGGLGPGTYAFSVTDANGCMSNGETELNSPDSLSVELALRDESCQGSANGSAALNVSGGTGPYSYAWSNGSQGASAMNLVKGRYTVTVSDANDCRFYLEANIGRSCDGLVIYDVFSPNGDGKNDQWIIEGIDRFPDNRLTIYDRWGLLVYSAQSYTGDWDGRHNNGSTLPFGAYFYVLHLGDPADTLLKGSVTIIR